MKSSLLLTAALVGAVAGIPAYPFPFVETTSTGTVKRD
jgi:hypothetical protein